MKKFLIIGAGLSGIVISRLLTNKGYYCHILDERNHIGGNCYTKKYNDDIYIHVYGPHVFHTSYKDVWKFINKYDDFLSFQLNVKAYAKDNNLYSLPFNMNTFKEIFHTINNKDVLDILENEIKESYTENPNNLEEQAINMVGKTVYELLIKEYTEKQWGKPCKELDKNIIKRLPVRLSWNNNYYDDIYQGIPEHGYTYLLENMLNGINDEQPITYELNTQFNLENIDKYLKEYDYIIYTGQIDKLLDYCLGDLEWRSLKFDHQEVPNTLENDLGCNTINFTSHNQLYTRIVDHYYFNHISNDFKDENKMITYEYPDNYDKTKIAYYPINNEKNQNLYEKYVNLLKTKYPNILLLGRLGLYKYFDMDDIIKNCFNFLNFFNDYIK